MSDFTGPVNLGSEEKISLNDFAKLIIQISGKKLIIKNVEGPVGVNGRTSDNTLASNKLQWQPKFSLKEGITQTFNWVNTQVKSLHETSI